MAKVTGIGGVFFKAKNDPKALCVLVARPSSSSLGASAAGAAVAAAAVAASPASPSADLKCRRPSLQAARI